MGLQLLLLDLGFVLLSALGWCARAGLSWRERAGTCWKFGGGGPGPLNNLVDSALLRV